MRLSISQHTLRLRHTFTIATSSAATKHVVIETSVGITAAAHHSPLVEYADLEGNILVENDPFHGVKVVEVRPELSGPPGIGVVEL